MPRLCIRLMTGGAVSLRVPCSLEQLDAGGLVGAVGGSACSMRSGRSTVTFQYPKAALSKILLCSLSSKARKVSQMRAMSGLAELAVLLAQVLAERPVPAGGVDQLHLAGSVRGLAVGQHPHIGGDAGVVEHVERQGDDRLQPVVLDDPAADIAFTLAGVAGEEGAAVVHLGNAAAERGALFHLGELVGEEQHLAVAGAGDQGEFRGRRHAR